jgi:hypothetical protein
MPANGSNTDTLCGYALADVRKSLREAIDHRDTRAAKRWTAELVATPGAVGSLWAAYWLAWAAAQGAGSASPTLPILLRQTWSDVVAAANEYVGNPSGGGWTAFRNDPHVRAAASEMTVRLLSMPRQTPVVWPTKEIILYDVSLMRDTSPPAATDGAVVMSVWSRDDDSMDLRLMAGRFLDALERGDLRVALSAVMWSLLPHSQQSIPLPLRVGDRGPAALPLKVRHSPLWFWLDLGKAFLNSRPNIHRGWPTFHAAVAEAFKLHYKRWTHGERMRMLLAWILQLRAVLEEQPARLWVADPVNQTLAEVDQPYKEIAAEMANPNAAIVRPEKAVKPEEDSKKARQAKIEEKMSAADAAVMAALGLTEEDME